MKRNKSEPEPSTLFEIARSGLDEASGRWAEQDARVVGTSQSAGSAYPAAATAQSDLVPAEPPLGESIEDMIPVGTVSEVAESLERLERERGDA
jgi:hypothetical protein